MNGTGPDVQLNNSTHPREYHFNFFSHRLSITVAETKEHNFFPFLASAGGYRMKIHFNSFFFCKRNKKYHVSITLRMMHTTQHRVNHT